MTNLSTSFEWENHYESYYSAQFVPKGGPLAGRERVTCTMRLVATIAGERTWGLTFLVTCGSLEWQATSNHKSSKRVAPFKNIMSRMTGRCGLNRDES